MDSAKPPFLGFGLGLRAQHYDEILNGNPPIDWFEAALKQILKGRR